MTKAPTVSILMNCLNGATYLREALDSVFAQTYKDWEVIFWDSGSTDNSVAIAKTYGKKVRVFHGPTVPLGQARNLALAKARGKYLAILDCDDAWIVSKLGGQVACLDHLYYPDFLFNAESFTGAYYHYRRLLSRPNYMLSPTLMFKTEQVRKLGGWNPTYHYAEMYDLCVRMAKEYNAFELIGKNAMYRIHPGQRCGRGHAAVTREVLDVMAQHRDRAPWQQWLREGLLWGKYGWQRLTHR